MRSSTESWGSIRSIWAAELSIRWEMAMVFVVPVHSQHRGRIFLPFVDDDPKTAEILSKILLFAEDDRIKDPGILSQIR